MRIFKRGLSLLLALLLVGSFAGCHQKPDSRDELDAINCYLIFSIDVRNNVDSDKYIKEKLGFSVADIVSRFGQKIHYVPSKGQFSKIYFFQNDISTQEYEKIVKYVIETYGEPTYSSGLKYIWKTETEAYKLVLMYDSEIMNHAVICIDEKDVSPVATNPPNEFQQLVEEKYPGFYETYINEKDVNYAGLVDKEDGEEGEKVFSVGVRVAERKNFPFVAGVICSVVEEYTAKNSIENVEIRITYNNEKDIDLETALFWTSTDGKIGKLLDGTALGTDGSSVDVSYQDLNQYISEETGRNFYAGA